MKQNTKRRLVSLVMVFAMLLSYIPGAVWAADATTDIKAIEKPTGISIVEDYDDYVGDTWLSSLGLPATVTITLANDTTAEVPVTWDSSKLDTRTPGYYSLPGTVSLPTGVTNGQNLSVAITVQVRKYSNLIVNPSFENNLDGWYISGVNPKASRVDTVAADGEYSVILGGSIEKQNFSALDTRNSIITSIPAGGLYYFGAKSQATAQSIPADIKFQCDLKYKTTTNGVQSSATTIKGERVTVNNTQFVLSGNMCELPANVSWIRTDLGLIANATTNFSALGICFDDVELIPLRIPLAVEPSAIQEITTEPLSRRVILNYPDYVGETWKDQLGLPQSVQVLTDNGTTAEVDVTWSFAGLDFTKYGKYIITGKLDDSGFPNPKELTVQQVIYVSKANNILVNGNFENDLNGWQNAWTSKTVKDPLNDANRVLFATKKEMVTSVGGSSVLYQRDPEGTAALVAAFLEAGVGQYYLSIDAMSAPYDDNNPALSDVDLWVDLKANTTGVASGAKLPATTGVTRLSTTEWTTLSTLVDTSADWNWMRTLVQCKAGAKVHGAVYLDNFNLLPINVTIPKGQEPADVVEILDEMPVRAVIQNYDKYVGANWKEMFNLPASVKVRTATGNEAMVDVNWDLSTLNLEKTGKYYIVGTLDNSVYPNPNELVLRHVIHVRDYKNLLSNPSYENGKTDWSFGSGSSSLVTNKYKAGTTAAHVITSAKLDASSRVQVAFTSSKNEAAQLALGERIALQGAGQYYLSSWAQYDGSDATGYGFFTALKYKMDLEGSASSADSDNFSLSATTWTQASKIFDLPAGIQWARMDISMTSPIGKLSKQGIYLDHAELVPLNVIVEQYEGAMKEVETLIPDRQIIQNYPNYIGAGYTTADLMLPETVTVRSTVGELIEVDVKWDYSSLDLTKVGTYTLYGVLEDIKLENTNALVVKQKIKVVAKQNMFSNSSFENETGGWKHHSNITLTANITKPVHSGNYSLQYDVGRLQSWKDNRIQSFYNDAPATVGSRVIKTGAGRYMFGAWVHGTTSSNDVAVELSMKYKSLSIGDSSVSTSSGQVKPSANKWTQIKNFVEIPDDVYWARLDMYIHGTPEQMRLSRLYLEDFELIPLNVEIPSLTDIIDMEEVADVYVYQGTSAEGLKLPATLKTSIKNGQKFEMQVDWDFSSYDPNKIGEQIITGALKLNGFKNPKEFTPTARIIIRAKGEALRQTIYISTSGSEDNDGLSPEKPKKELSKIKSYMQQGYNVMLKRGDQWYLPTGSITIGSVYATEDAPLVLGAYGSGEKPIIAFMQPIANSEWKLVDEKRNVYAADVSSIGAKNGESVHRCFIDKQSYTHMPRNNYVALGEGEFCSYDYTLYVRLPEGKVPKNVEVTAYNAGHRFMIDNVAHMTVENIHFRGASATSSNIYVTAPTEYLKFLHVDYTESFYFAYYFASEGTNLNYKTEIGYCTINANFNEAEGWKNYDKNWNVGIVEGILFNNGADGAWIHHNTLIDQGHGFITLQANGRDSSHETPGTFNCIIEDNLLIGDKSQYNRAFNLAGGYNQAGAQTCRNNIVRRNRVYGMNTASHLFGEDLLIYSNLMSYTHCAYEEDGALFDGKTAQPWAWDTVIYSDKNSVGVMMINNTFYNVSGAIAISDKANTVYNNIYANNLVVNYTSDPPASPGAFVDITSGLQYVMNNGVYSHTGVVGPFNVDNKQYSAEEVNDAVAGYSGNIYANPLFVNADLTLMDKYVQQEFELSTESPFRYTGLSLYDPVYQSFAMWEKLAEEYTDINGVVYLAESPSIGAWSYCERIKGEVAEVGKLSDILARPGAKFEQLNLPDAVPAKNEKGVEVMLLTTWDASSFDSSKPGTITLTAQLRNGPHTELNVEGKVATININIKDKLELLSVTTALNGVTVLYGTSFEDVLKQLPQTLDVREESGYQEALPVTWTCASYDPIKPDSYTFKCVLPEDMISNVRDFDIEIEVRLLHEIGRGMELLVNPDFVGGNSAAPWTMGWGTGTIKVTTDPNYLLEGHPGAMIVTADGKYGSAQQSVLGQLQLMGNGKYLFKMYIRAFDPAKPIDNTVAVLKVFAPVTYSVTCRAKSNIGTDWVECSAIMDVTDVESATDILFHTSTYKTEEDIGRSYVIAGCSLIFLGTTDAEVEATLDSIDLTWNSIKGDNESEENITSNLVLPSKIGTGSTIKWTSSDESAITNDGKVIPGRTPKMVTMTATITYDGVETVKKFIVTVPRNPDLPNFTGTLTGTQDAVKIGDEFKVTISLSSDKATAYNAYRFTVSFNASKLEYVGISDPTSTVDVEGGKLTISGIGTERPITDTFTITFKAKKSGITEVKLVKIEMDANPDLTLDTLPTMTVENGTVVVDVLKSESEDKETVDVVEKDNSVVIWIVIGLVAAALIAGGVIVIILIKKKKQLPPATEE